MTDPETIATRRSVLVANYHANFATLAGAAVLKDLRKHFDPMAASFSPETGYDPIKAAVRDGQRQVLIHILTLLESDPEAPVTPLQILTD